MSTILKSWIILICFCGINLNFIQAQEQQIDSDATRAYTFKLHNEIFDAALHTVKRAIKEANEMDADYLVMDLNTYGGRVDIADSIRTALLNSPITTVVLINNNAASAGALISLACDSIFMVPGAQMGAATVVNGTDGQQMPDKYQSYMRATMRSTAEVQNRDPMIAEAMVDDRVSIPNIIEEGKTLTFTTEEAIKHGYSEGSFQSITEVLEHLQPSPTEVMEYKETTTDRIIAFLLNPALHGALLMIMFAGVYFELQSPGLGFPILAAIVAAVLYFLPNYIEGLAANWEIALFVVGLILLLAEVFVIPGFGVAGILGITAILTSLILSMVQNQFFDFTFTPPGSIGRASNIVLISFVLSTIALFALGGSLLNSAAFKRMSVASTQQSSEGYSIKQVEMDRFIGMEGVAVTDLKISGRVEIENERHDAITQGGFIEKGTNIKVLENRGNYLVVREA